MDLERVEEALASMKKYGFFVIENYWSEEKCQEALNELLDVSLPCFDVGQGGDLRLNRANQSLATAKEFLKDSFIQEVANRYSNCKRADRIVAGIVKQQQGKDTGSAGTCILIDSTYVHRGKKINKGTRYTYTNYFYEVVQDAE